MIRKGAGLVVGAFGFALCLTDFAIADELDSFRGTGQLRERTHSISATVHPGYAELVVRREIENLGMEPDEARLLIELPEGAVAIGLRTRGHGPSAPWYEGKLLEAKLAEAQYRELTGKGEAMLRDPALLYWLSPRSVGLQVFPCPPGKSQWVEYTLLVPTQYEDGAHVFSLEPLGTESLTATWTIRAGDSRDHLSSPPVEVEAGGTLRVTPEVAMPVVLREHAPEALSGSFASVPLGSGRSYVRGAFRTGPGISTVPENLRLAILVDTSRSMGAGTMERVGHLAQALFPWFPKVEVALVAFDRMARPITDGFVTPERALRALREFPTSQRNGSELVLGLDAVARLFSNVPVERRRLLVLTDTETRESLSTEVLETALGRVGALTHWSDLDRGTPSLSFDDRHELADAVKKTGGLTWLARVEEDENLSAVVEEWARPLRYRLRSVLLDGARAEFAFPETLGEGEGFEIADVREASPKTLLLEAELWGKTEKFSFKTRADEERRSAALLVVDGHYQPFDLTDEELKRLAEVGRAVTPWTSYLALEPGVRPSTQGLERGGEGIGLGGIGSAHGRLFGCHLGVGSHFDPRVFLEERVGWARTDCGAGDRPLTVALESTRDELVAVDGLSITPSDAQMERCLVEKLWAIELPEGANRIARGRTTVALQ